MSLCCRVIGSAHYLTKINILVKFNENHLKGSRDMERTRNSRVNPLTLTLSLVAESCAPHTVLLQGKYESSFMKIDQRFQEICSRHEIQR